MINWPAKKNNDSWYPISEINNFHREVNRLVDFMFPRWGLESSLMTSRWAPAMDVYDSKGSLVVKADLPGFTKDNIHVSVEDDVLTIRGERKEKSEIQEENYLKTERYHGSFQRVLQLPAHIDSSKVNAVFKDGVLELTLGKKQEAKSKQISIDIT